MKTKTNTTTLFDITGYESGIVIYHGDGGTPEGIVCNWSLIQGFPRVDPLGLTVLGFSNIPDIPDDEPIQEMILADALPDNTEIIFHHGELSEMDGNERCHVWALFDGERPVTVICPADWN